MKYISAQQNCPLTHTEHRNNTTDISSNHNFAHERQIHLTNFHSSNFQYVTVILYPLHTSAGPMQRYLKVI